MSLHPLSTKKLISPVLVVTIALLLAAALSRSVESAGNRLRSSTPTQSKGANNSQAGQSGKLRRFANVDVRSTEPRMMANIAAANANTINQRLQSRKTALDQAMTRLRTFSRGAQAKASPLTGAVEIVRSTTGALPGVNPGRNGDNLAKPHSIKP